jgi:hypothetical protein
MRDYYINNTDTWESDFRRCHGIRDGDVKLDVEFELLQVDDVPTLAEPAGPLFIGFEPEPEKWVPSLL